MKQTPPPLDLPDSSTLSAWKTEKDSVGQMTRSGTSGVSHISIRQKILQSLMPNWSRILTLISSNECSSDWRLAIRMLGRGGRWAWTLSLNPASFPPVFPSSFPWRRVTAVIVVAHSYYLRLPLVPLSADTFVQKKMLKKN